MDLEMNADPNAALESAAETIDRLTAAAEQLLARLESTIAAAEQKLAELDARAADPGAPNPGAPSKLRLGGIAATEPTTNRKTLPTAMTTLLSKQGIDAESLEPASLEAGALDAALSSLSLEQRIAVKAQLLRAGLVSQGTCRNL